VKAIVYDQPGTFAVTEVPDPVAGPGELVVRVLVAGLCGTDLHLHDGEFGPSYPLTPGHEVAGEVVAAGPGVTTPRVGQRVTFDNTAACGRCVECRRGRPVFCRHAVAQGVNAPGGFAEYVLTDADRCFVVDDLAPEVAVFAEPLACVVHGLDVLALPVGSDVLVVGAGPTGLLLTQMLARSGAASVTVAAPSEAKLAIAAQRGADQTVVVGRGDPTALTRAAGALRPEGYDVVIDATGAVGVLEQTLDLTRTRGTVFVYGMAAEQARWPVRPYDVFRRELTIKGSFAQQFAFDRSIAALRNGTVDTSGLITHEFPLEDFGAALAATASSECIKAAIVPHQDRATA
jgi:D-arabinitol dehydrogenase (NADP+)